MIYTMCKYTPTEIFAGFDEETTHLEASGDTFDQADSMGHPNLCGYGKGLLEAAMAPEGQEMVLVNCCDVVRRIYDILSAQKEMKFLYLLDLPHKTDRADLWMMQWQVQKLIDAYAAYSGKTFDVEKFRAACETADDENDEKRKNACDSLQLGSADAKKASDHNGANSERETEKHEKCTHYVSLVGAHGGTSLPQMIASRFRVPIKDETCSANRDVRVVWSKNQTATKPSDSTIKSESSNTDVIEEDEKTILSDYSAALLKQTPCMRMTQTEKRRQLGEGADGIIYHTMKFCDYYGFEYASRVQEHSVPILKIETDATNQSEGQLATRLDAFAESLKLSHHTKREVEMGKYTAGIDSGSSSTDVVILNDQQEIVAWTILKTGAGAANGAERALEQALEKAGISRDDLCRIVTTGYGRETLGIGDDSVTEITCHAKGAHYLNPDVRTIIDIGGQDSKVIKVDENGDVVSFVMNDKCAAGTGRFLEMMARTMEMSMEDMSERGLQWKEQVQISSMCTVFAESEVVSLIAKNVAPENIIHGLNQSVSNRTAALVKRVGGEEAFMMTGGVARNKGVVEVLSEKLGTKIFVSEHAQLCGAIGAALL